MVLGGAPCDLATGVRGDASNTLTEVREAAEERLAGALAEAETASSLELQTAMRDAATKRGALEAEFKHKRHSLRGPRGRAGSTAADPS